MTTSPKSGTGPAVEAGQSRPAPTRLLWAASLIVLVPVAGIGAGLSFRSLYEAAVPTFGIRLAFGFPLLVDMLILGTSLAYLAGLSDGCPRPGWRWSAHGGVLGTLALNAMAAPDAAGVAWHVTAPAVWSVLVEMTGRQMTARRPDARATTRARIPGQLWLTSPVEAVRIWQQMTRTGDRYPAVISAVANQTAAMQTLKIALPHRTGHRVRRVVARHLRSGTLAPEAVLRAVDWPHTGPPQKARTPDEVLSAVLYDVLHNAASPPTTTHQTPPPDGKSPPTRKPTPGRGTDRSATALAILRAQPTIDGPGLTRELADKGWPVSDRTATRILATIRRDTAVPSAGGPA